MTEFLLPDIGDGLTEAEVVRWLVPEGAQVDRDEPLVEVETDKAVVVIPSPVAGIVLRHGAGQGETMSVGTVLAVIAPPGEGNTHPSPPGKPGAAEPRPTHGPPASETPEPTVEVKALPVVRRLARQRGVDLTTVTGSGPGGRITRDDVLAAAQAAAPPTAPRKPESLPDEDHRRRPLTKLQRTVAANMTRSWSEIPHVTTFDEVDATRLLGVRRALAERHGSTIQVDALVIAAIIPALRRYTEFNATLEGDSLVVHAACHMGVAINAADGLLVGVVRSAEEMSIMQLAEATARLAEQGKTRRLGVGELTGQTFTVSNIGALGGGLGTPIIPPDNTAILAVGRVADRPVVEGGEVVVRPMMPLSLSFDHRVIDGALSRLFMDMVIENLSEPALFLA
ncbi:MAG: 2-oxo acid dehydrogenase subunit E2 [Actinomycetia bacterium]|nr:2-oxo acid dehydrogenase subunit E2 [Actinomycetes bacterium]